jgi:hypothetical protein
MATNKMGAVSRGEYADIYPSTAIQPPVAEDIYQPYVSPDVPMGSDEAVAAAEAAAAEAENQAAIMDEMGLRRYVNQYAPSKYTIKDKNAVLPASEQMAASGQNIGAGTGAGGTYKASDGTLFTNYSDYLYYQDGLDKKIQSRKSAYDVLFQQFSQWGLGSIVEPLKAIIEDTTIDPSLYSFYLANDPKYNKAYKQRFSANDARIAKGLKPLDPATYLKMEDAYQTVMRNYGLPESYWKVGELGKQEGFDKLIANNVDPTVLEDRILNAQNRVLNANPEVLQALKNFYPDIKNGDILAYVLDPDNAITNIKKKISAAEIGGAAMAAGLGTSAQRAEQLASYGVTGQAYQQASPFLTSAIQRGSQLADIYGQSPYGQTQAEQEAFNLAGGTEAARERRKLTELEKASFGGSSGASGGALSRDRALNNSGAGAY